MRSLKCHIKGLHVDCEYVAIMGTWDAKPGAMTEAYI